MADQPLSNQPTPARPVGAPMPGKHVPYVTVIKPRHLAKPVIEFYDSFQVKTRRGFKEDPPLDFPMAYPVPAHIPPVPHKCNCTRHQVVHFGCKCGGV